jgi:hypothetical protein
MARISGDSYLVTPAEVDHFQREGYVTLHNVVTEAELQDIEDTYMKLIRNDVDVDFGADYGDHSSPAGTPQDDWKMVNVTLPSVHYPAFSGNVFERRGLAIARQLYPAHGLAMVWEYDQLLAKRPRRADAVFPAHQDSGYWYTPAGVPTATATCSLAINSATEANGCLFVVPGSHRSKLFVLIFLWCRERCSRPHEDTVGGAGEHLLQAGQYFALAPCTTLHGATLHYSAWRYSALLCLALHCTTLHGATLHFSARHYSAWRYSAWSSSALL